MTLGAGPGWASRAWAKSGQRGRTTFKLFSESVLAESRVSAGPLALRPNGGLRSRPGQKKHLKSPWG
jgi:hypothetical protein